MLFLLSSLLILLVVPADLLVSAGNGITCDGSNQHLSCDVRVICEGGDGTLDCESNLIQIISANYGRTDRSTCSAGRPRNQMTNTNCYAPDTLSTVLAGCNGKSSCTLHATNTIFTDPCVGTFKYLTVSYFCIPPPLQTSVTCEGDSASLSCGSGVLKILSANYGRLDSTTCTSGRPNSQITKTDCFATGSLAEVVNRCRGKSSCVVPASNDVFTDPCQGTYKYLSIVYSCVLSGRGKGRHTSSVA